MWSVRTYVPDIPLVYVYLGNPLPRYARISLGFARKRFLGPIIVLSDMPATKSVFGTTQIDIRDWYDPGPFRDFLTSADLDGNFRQGFWLHAIERFFVLEQYLSVSSTEKLFHAELDVLIFDINALADELDLKGKGLFAPAESDARAIASLIYVNTLNGITDFLGFAGDNGHLGNEMKILGGFLGSNSPFAHALSSERVFDPDWPFFERSVSLAAGIVDCSALGHWLLGQDPRNSPKTSWNLFKGAVGFDMSSLRFRANLTNSSLQVRGFGKDWQNVLALHVHAKTFLRFRFPFFLSFLCHVANMQLRIPISIRTGALRVPVFRILFLLGEIASKTRFSVAKKIMGLTIARWAVIKPSGLSSRQMSTLQNLLSDTRQNIESKKIFAPRAVIPRPLASLERCLDGLSTPQRGLFEREIYLLLDAMDQPRVTRYVGFQGQYFATWKHDFHADSKISLVTSASRHESLHRLNENCWPEVKRCRLSFSRDHLDIDPTWLREMFPGGLASIAEWITKARRQKKPDLSLAVSYSEWAFCLKRRAIKLVAERDCANFDSHAGRGLPNY